MKKKQIRLTEKGLNKIVAESVNRVLKEHNNPKWSEEDNAAYSMGLKSSGELNHPELAAKIEEIKKEAVYNISRSVEEAIYSALNSILSYVDEIYDSRY